MDRTALFLDSAAIAVSLLFLAILPAVQLELISEELGAALVLATPFAIGLIAAVGIATHGRS